MLQNIIINFDSNATRQDQMEGRDFTVAPMVMLTEGVHNGSNGPLLYPAAEIQKATHAWNYKPIVVYHPTLNGAGVSACSDPDILTTHKIGVVMNARWDKKAGKLRAEAWLEDERVALVDNRVGEALEANTMMEVSTGLFTTNEATPGTWNDKEYVGIARDYQPDHLAFLPDQVGACSIADGAGLLQLNAMSNSNVRQTLSGLLRGRVGDDAYIEDVYPSFFIYEQDGLLYRLYYEQTDTDATIKEGGPEEVKRVTEYRTVLGAFVGNTTHPKPFKKDEDSMAKATLVDALIENKATQFGDGDKEFLMSLNEEQLGKLAPVVNTELEGKPADPPTKTPVQLAAEEGAEGLNPTAPTENKEEPKPQTPEEYANAAPPEMRDLLINSLADHRAKRDAMIATITANTANTMTAEELAAMTSNQLTSMAALATPPAPATPTPGTVPSFAGASTPGPTANHSAGAGAAEDMPVPPTMNFGEGDKE